MVREKPKNVKGTFRKLTKYIGKNKYLLFALVILVGAVLLWLPFATTAEGSGSFLTAAFTSTSGRSGPMRTSTPAARDWATRSSRRARPGVGARGMSSGSST